MSQASWEAPSNIAFVKYWGRRQNGPANPSLSMTLSQAVTQTTVQLGDPGTADRIWVIEAAGVGHTPSKAFREGVERHLGVLRTRLGIEASFRVATRNSFPTAAGIASSASGFSALALAVAAAAGAKLSVSELSECARDSGSGSAARSVLGGYVRWPGRAADGSECIEGPAVELAPADHWRLLDLIAVVDSSPKGVSSRQGHERAPSSPHFERRLELLPERIATAERAVLERDFATLGPLIEQEAIELHLIAMSSQPPIYYWSGGTLEVLSLARKLREEGVEVYATIDAGPNVHLICTPEVGEVVAARVDELESVERLIVDETGSGPRPLEEALPLPPLEAVR